MLSHASVSESISICWLVSYVLWVFPPVASRALLDGTMFLCGLWLAELVGGWFRFSLASTVVPLFALFVLLSVGGRSLQLG